MRGVDIPGVGVDEFWLMVIEFSFMSEEELKEAIKGGDGYWAEDDLEEEILG